MKLLVALPIAAGLIWHRQNILAWSQRADLRGVFAGFSGWDIIACGLLGSYLVVNLSAALGPEFYYDSLVYHLALPKLYLLAHRIVPTPTMLYSGIPFGTEMLYGLGLGLADERLAKLIQCGFGIATAGAVFCWCRSRMRRSAAILAALLFYCAPMVCFESGVAKVELACAFYTLLAVFAMLEAQERPAGNSRYQFLTLAGIFAGLSVSTKYNAGLYMFMLPIPLIYRCIRGQQTRRALGMELGVFLGLALMTASPWFLKNAVFYGNPIYPFLNHLWGNNLSVNAAGLASDAGARDLVQAFTTLAGVKDFFAGIWSPAWPLDNVAGIAFQILLPWVFLARPEPARRRSMMLIMVGIWLAWALHTRMPRFLLPALPVLAVLSAEAVFLPEFPRFLRYFTIGAVYGTLILTLGGAVFVWYAQGLWSVAFRFSGRDSYLSHPHHSYLRPYYAGTKYINANTPVDSKVLFLGEERGFYSERRFITASVFDVNPIIGWADSASDGAALLEKLKVGGISHLLVNRAAPRYYEMIQSMSSSGRSAYEALLAKHARLIFDDRHDSDPNDLSWVQVYAL
ncbi:MAG: phospholipid carrier-dependent glycosyltransferase [Elusimicrobia bacterium]|nr:phospholipid carrier-dependent glycosyltransferase [Elusimicrobiota bacterium]